MMPPSPPAAAPTLPGVFDTYVAAPDSWDELRADGRTLRPHWRAIAASLTRLGRERFAHRWEHGRRLIQENGVTYNIHGDTQGQDRPWELDAIPFVVSAAEWKSLEPAIIQRARLLNAIMADLYGPQRLVRDGVIPGELVFANPGFLRPCHGMQPAAGNFLSHVAIDLVRGTDGRWKVLTDQTQTPSGTGYALENRVILSRTFPGVFRDSQVRRLTGFYESWQASMQTPVAGTRVVLLSPGPESPNYFEHSYLARYLGVTLVEGEDMTVRGNRLFLKTLAGLSPVERVIRQMDDVLCDPLELTRDSAIGVPGLLQSALAREVQVLNALGSGVLESPALRAYFPAIARHLLDEEPALPSMEVLWYGRPGDRQRIHERREAMTLLPAFSGRPFEPIAAANATDQGRAAIEQLIAERPHMVCAQETVRPSCAPVWGPQGPEARPVIWRVFAMANPDGSFRVLPGGLCRILPEGATTADAHHMGGGSKDTWVIAERSLEGAQSVAPPRPSLSLSRAAIELPSRVADNLFWLGRYAERVDSTARLLRALIARLTDEWGTEQHPEVPALLDVLAAFRHTTAVDPTLDFATYWETVEREVMTATMDVTSSGSLLAQFHAVCRASRAVRDRVSVDMWRLLSQLDPATPAGEAGALSDMIEFIDHVIVRMAGFGGLTMESMTRGYGWRFLDMGRRTERAVAMITALNTALGMQRAGETSVLQSLLEIGDSSMTYRSRYLTQIEVAPVLDLLLADETNPRSVAFQLAALSDHVGHLPHLGNADIRGREQRLALSTLSAVRLADLSVLAQPDTIGQRAELVQLCANLLRDLPALSDALTQRYFSHAVPRHQIEYSSLERTP